MTKDEIRRQELSDFLRNRRGRIAPADVGLPATNRRRTPGLRREEVAQLAGVSATWYTWLEQKRPIGVSSGVLDNLARVLRLDPAERMQLFQLALRQPVLDSLSKRETVSPLIRRLLDRTDPIPAFVLGRRWDVLAWNRAARRLLFRFRASARKRTKYALARLHQLNAALLDRRLALAGPGHARQIPRRLWASCWRCAFCAAGRAAQVGEPGVRGMVAAS